MYKASMLFASKLPQHKKYWEANIPNKRKQAYSGPSIVTPKQLDSNKVVLLHRLINKNNVLAWIKEMKLCVINYFVAHNAFVITFGDEESAALCKLTWGGPPEDDDE